MHEPDTQLVPPRGSNPADEARPAQAREREREEVREDPVVLRRWVGRYELIHRLAHGGMATVYLGRAKGKAGFEKVVAVKVIHPHLAGEAEFVGMFLDEARIAARIHHPHVVETLDLGESDGAYFMVMEFIEGENLSALTRALGRERLPIPVALQIIADTLEGLCAAHELRDAEGRPYKLVHRDVSPHNILVNLDGWAKVADFGIMKAAGKASNTRTGELRGKLAYMSPEQARGVAVDHRTDLFAVGVILWELLTGERLFACATEAATLEKVMACEVPTLASSGVECEQPEVCAGLQALLDRALAPESEARPADARAMLGEVKRLQRLVEELPASDQPRAQLGDLVRRFFARRVDYARAALRRTGEHPVVGASASVRDWIVDPTVQVGRPTTGPQAALDHTPTLSEPNVERPITGSNPQLGSGPITGAHAQLARPSSLAQWSLWLLLPMLGAGIAIAAMLLFGPGFERREPVASPEPPASEPPTPAVETPPSSLAATNYAPVARREIPAGQVGWYFSTAPAGARVLIDGEVRGEPTPTWVHVPTSEEPYEVRIELDGYEPLTRELPAVHAQTFSETLTPVPAAPADKPAKRARRPGKPKQGSTKPDAGTDAQTKPGFLPVPDSLRGQE